MSWSPENACPLYTPNRRSSPLKGPTPNFREPQNGPRNGVLVASFDAALWFVFFWGGFW